MRTIRGYIPATSFAAAQPAAYAPHLAAIAPAGSIVVTLVHAYVERASLELPLVQGAAAVLRRVLPQDAEGLFRAADLSA